MILDAVILKYQDGTEVELPLKRAASGNPRRIPVPRGRDIKEGRATAILKSTGRPVTVKLDGSHCVVLTAGALDRPYG
jgi:hypothetical protein